MTVTGLVHAGCCDIALVRIAGSVYHQPFDLSSAVLEVPVFTMAGGGISNEEGVRFGQSVRRIGIYPRLFHWMIVRTCILMQTLVFNVTTRDSCNTLRLPQV
jgi:hypothetical protein